MSRGLCIYLALSVLSGTLLALQFFWGAVVLVLLLLSLFQRKMPRTILFVSFLLVIISFFHTFLQEKNQKSGLSPQSEPSTHQVFIDEIPTIDGSSFVSFAKMKNEKILIRYYFDTEEEKRKFAEVNPGFVCNVKGQLAEPRQDKNPNSFNYKDYLSHQGVYWILEIQEFEGCVDRSTWKHTLTQLRFQGLKRIEREFPPSTVGITQALLFGETGMITEDSMKAFRELGVVHLLAISGLHVGLLFAILHYLLLRMGLTREAASWTGVLFLLCYIVMTGGSPSVVRASFMLILLLLGKKTSRNIGIIDSLATVFLIMVLYEPFSVYNVGFQLSFAVSFSLVLSSRTILQASSSIKQMVAVTMVAQLSSIPFVIYHFYEFSLIGFLTNLLYVPLFSIIILPMAIITYLLISVVSAGWSMIPYQILLEGIQWLSAAVASFPFSTLIMGRPNFVLLLGYLILIYFAFVGIEKRKYLSFGFLFLFFVLHLFLNKFHPYGEIVFIDVGQGDATLIDLPYNQGTYLIDAGGEVPFPKEEWEEKKNRFSVGEDIVVPFLKSKGITSIDTLILTHGDLDHIGGAEAVLNEMKVGEILISPGTREKVEVDRIVKMAKEKRISVKEVMYPVRWRGDRDGLHIVSPLDADYAGNNDSIVLYGEIGSKKWLFTGDLEKEGEKEFIQTFDLPVDVLKVGHHGSNTSTSEAFLAETNPDVAVISAGETNRFGHPHPEVVERLKVRGLTIYSTAVNGAITYRFWDKKGTFSAQLP
ncbi:DNA internalization-related competence protein ComEC/Rec2 [Rossellomorea sp. SC111]|uniref:DNA internalization-related competence protein ComEC/Rec2 n=1 Tax=Rossellomorea sp. SC111 TaxID=2968985 RepID=UPI00215AB0AA|nr:DNA internalization-related competence protein ComEC/Rec2 [Rossellomorea sp. SC111]MCR8850660.1 DNA internalization-related competence protein ComEC/Rec2 [Rossellomorea sp. SC111]